MECFMLQLAAPLFEQNLVYARKLVADLHDDQMTTQPVSTCVLNHAAFIIGHLAWVCDFGVTLLGETAAIDPKWRDLFSLTAKPVSDRSVYPSKVVLVKAFEDAHTRLATVALAAKPELLQLPPPERFRNRFPALAPLMLHMLTNHEAVHLGQLSAWRRACGLPPA
jgi:DinB superfamily